MAKNKFCFKTIVSIFLAVAMIFSLSVTASAVEPLYSDTSKVSLQIVFSGTTAYCTVSVIGTPDAISVTNGKLVLQDSEGEVIEFWDNLSSDSRTMSVTKIASKLTSGEKYTLIFSADVIRSQMVEPVSSSTSKYC